MYIYNYCVNCELAVSLVFKIKVLIWNVTWKSKFIALILWVQMIRCSCWWTRSFSGMLSDNLSSFFTLVEFMQLNWCCHWQLNIWYEIRHRSDALQCDQTEQFWLLYNFWLTCHTYALSKTTTILFLLNNWKVQSHQCD